MKPALAKLCLADYLHWYHRQSLSVLEAISKTDLTDLIELLRKAREENRQIFVCGNGGSAAHASHFCVDLGKGASLGQVKRFRVLSLNDNVSWMTALANDLDYSMVYVEQLRNYAKPGDLLVALSVSGELPNVIKAVQWANENGLHTIGITGRPGGKLGKLATLPIFIESSHPGHVEQGHCFIQHAVSFYFQEGKDRSSSQETSKSDPRDLKPSDSTEVNQLQY